MKTTTRHAPVTTALAMTLALLATPAAFASEQVDVVGPTIFPPEIAVPAGATLRIHNRGDEPVTIVSEPATGDGAWSVGPIEPGQSKEIVITPELVRTYAVQGGWMKPAVIKLQ